MIYKNDPLSIQGFLEDTSNLKTGSTTGVFFPETVQELQELLQRGPSSSRFTIAGNGTGTTGGRIPQGGSVISTEKLNAIGEPIPMEKGRASIRVQAGALLMDIQEKVQRHGWLYPPDPTEKLCFIGSTIANNSSGARTFKYGPTRSHIASLLVILANGEQLEIERGRFIADSQGRFHFEHPVAGLKELERPNYRMPITSKHNAGYYSQEGMDLIDLFIGSEGTLGIIVEADLILIPFPPGIISGLFYFPLLEQLMRFVEALKAEQGENRPRAIEFFDANALGFLAERYADIPEDVAGAVFIEQECAPEAEEAVLGRLLEHLDACGGLETSSWIAMDREEQEKIREFRHTLPLLVNEWLSRQQESKISTDMAVPDESFAELLEFYRTACEENGFVYIIFGHIGNAHVHLNILPRNHREFLEAKKLYRQFVVKVIELGGTLSAEHGIGKLKSEYLGAMYGQEGIMEMVRIKRSLDPHLRLNIGNIIQEKYLAEQQT